MFKLPYYWFGILLSIATGCLFGLTFVANCWLGWNDLLVSAVLQVAGVFLALTLAYFFFELRSHQREERVKKTIHLFTDRLQLIATEAVVSCAEQFLMEPGDLTQVDRSKGNKRYENARELTITQRLERRAYENKPMTYESLRNTIEKFQVLAGNCRFCLDKIGPSLNEFGFLMRAMITLERYIEQEIKLWKDFAEKNEGTTLVPGLAKGNLVALSQLAIELVDILERADFRDSPRRLNGRRYPPAGVGYAGNWGGDLL